MMNRRLVYVLGLVGTFACGGGIDAPSDGACPVIKACPHNADRRPELDPACNAQLSAYLPRNWKLPKTKTILPVVDDDTDAYSIATGFAFGPDRYGETNQQAWLDKGQDLQMEMTLSVGSGYLKKGGSKTLYAVVLINGEPVPFVWSDGDPKTINSFALDDNNRAQALMRVAASDLSDGASSGAFLVTSRTGFDVMAQGFTILNGSAAFPTLPGPVHMDTIKVPATTGSIVHPKGTQEAIHGPSDDGSLPLTLEVTPTWTGSCTNLTQRALLVPLLDHAPVSLGDMGVHPAFEMRQGQAMQIDVDLKVPVDDFPHVLEFWWLEGDGAYFEAPPGSFSAWQSPPTSIANVSWGMKP
jgi:hypothetical protein